MTIPVSCHDVTTPTENLAGIIIDDLLQINMFTKYFPTLMFTLLQHVVKLRAVYGNASAVIHNSSSPLTVEVFKSNFDYLNFKYFKLNYNFAHFL